MNELLTIEADVDEAQQIDDSGLLRVSPGEWVTIRVRLSVAAPAGSRIYVYLRYGDGNDHSVSSPFSGLGEPSDTLEVRYRLWELAAPGVCAIRVLQVSGGGNGAMRTLINHETYPIFVVSEPAVPLGLVGIDVTTSGTIEAISTDVDTSGGVDQGDVTEPVPEPEVVMAEAKRTLYDRVCGAFGDRSP